ncbi:MAG: hypothetical protein VX028_03405 [Nanoarchaeota archaeon]|nr:hypothetical protein [Nanoarchaeota archaeon]
MLKRIFSLILLFQIVSFAFAAENLQCEWKPQDQCAQNDTVLHVHSNVFNNAPNSQPSEFMSSHVSIFGDSNYDTALCCTSPLNIVEDRLSFYGEPTSNNKCTNNDQPLFFLTNYTNGIVALNETFNSAIHNTVICADLPTTASAVRLEIDNTSFFEQRGYQCLFRMSDDINGRVSSCAAEYSDFGITGQYPYAVWAQVIESDSTLRCNSDCTSKLDNRVYSSCALRIPSCFDVPEACDGSLYGGWVDLPTTPVDVYGNYKEQINCEAPWTETRLNPLYIEPTEDSSILVESVEGECQDIISQQYSVLVDNIPYKMNIYICNNN